MGGNQINLFKYRYGLSVGRARNGSWLWGDYVEMLQGGTGAALTWELTGYYHNNWCLNEVKSLVEY